MKKIMINVLRVIGYIISSVILMVFYTFGGNKLKKVFKMDDVFKKEEA